jgi:hypothetical protein
MKMIWRLVRYLFNLLLELAALGNELDFEEEGEPSYLQESAMELNLPNTASSEPQQVCLLIKIKGKL